MLSNKERSSAVEPSVKERQSVGGSSRVERQHVEEQPRRERQPAAEPSRGAKLSVIDPIRGERPYPVQLSSRKNQSAREQSEEEQYTAAPRTNIFKETENLNNRSNEYKEEYEKFKRIQANKLLKASLPDSLIGIIDPVMMIVLKIC